ncbi:MAG: organomercurial lyase [Actinomycetota bacterium]
MEPEQATLDDRVRVFVYRFMIDNGRPPMPVEIGTALETTTVRVEAALGRLADAHVLVLAPGTPYIWLANPLSALPSPFSVSAGGAQHYGICIWDALGVIAMLGDEGRVTSRCPDCGDELTLKVSAGEIEPLDYVVHYAVPAAQWWDDIGHT